MGNKAKQKHKQNNRGVNVHSVVYASVGCDSVSVVLCGGVRVICSFCVEIEHTERQHSWETEEEKHTNRMSTQG